MTLESVRKSKRGGITSGEMALVYNCFGVTDAKAPA